MTNTPTPRPDVEGIYEDLPYVKGCTVHNMAALIAWIEALEARQVKLLEVLKEAGKYVAAYRRELERMGYAEDAMLPTELMIGKIRAALDSPEEQKAMEAEGANTGENHE